MVLVAHLVSSLLKNREDFTHAAHFPSRCEADVELFELADIADILAYLALDPEVECVKFEALGQCVYLVGHYDHPAVLVFYLFEYLRDD